MEEKVTWGYAWISDLDSWVPPFEIGNRNGLDFRRVGKEMTSEVT